MKRTLSMIALAALTMGLLGSCSKINERLDNLEKKVSGIENEQIASINSQIDGIKTSIADLGTIRSDISSLKQSASDHSVDIFNLEEADRALADRILNLEDYVDAVLPKYAEKEWVEATFSTLAQYEATCDTIAKIDARIGALDAKLSKDIKATADSLTKWVNKQFEGYYTAAEMDASLAQMKSDIDSARAAGKISDAKADSIASELTNAKAAVDTAKANIRKEYRAAIDTAIKTSEGKLTKELTDKIATVNTAITNLTTRVTNLEKAVADLTGRVKALEEMIQSVVIVPAYSDGSVEIANDSLYIDCIVSPSKAVVNLVAGNVAVLVNKVKTKANTGVDTIKIIEGNVFEKDADKGVISVRVFIKNKIPAAGSTLTVAVNVKKDKSDFTTEFVPVTRPVSVSLDKHSIVVQSPDSDKDTTLTATVKNSTKGVSWTSLNTNIATVDNGTITIKANATGKDTIVVKTVEGNAADTCFVKVLPKGALAGEFSVSATKKVHFSKGNLYADGDKALHFEANQYSYASSWNASHVSHFTWSSTVAAAVGNSNSGDNLFCDESHKVSVDGGEPIYYELSKDEWTYLFNNHSKKWATVNGVNGYVIAPDGFTGELASSYADDAALASAGNLVFLPAAGYRDGSDFNLVGDFGDYWSSTASGISDGAYDVNFSSADVNPDRSVDRGSGFGVRLITDASAAPAPTPTTTGTAKATIGGSEVDVNWVQFWENGPKFAEYNVGVTDGKAESYGGYYCWGKAIDKDSSGSYKDGESALSGDDDTATKLWGSNWRMPTEDELQGLIDNCTVEWTQVNSVNGRKFTGKGAYASNSVFLPAAGSCFYGSVSGQGSNGCYWSSTPYGGDANYLDFYSHLQGMAVNNRNGGFSVRAVLK